MTSKLLTLYISAVLSQKYVLNHTFQGTGFFEQFEFMNETACAVSGFSNYITNISEAYAMGLINTTSTTAYMGTDYIHKVGNEGRAALCIGTKQRWNNNLFITDILHIPIGCGVWPSWWMEDGNHALKTCELDTIEGINYYTDDRSSLHSHANVTCDFQTEKNNINITGKWVQSGNCTQNGCSIDANNNNSYGKQFNDNGGGVYAHQKKENFIKLWFWKRDEIPNDIIIKQPNPSNWGIPYAEFTFGEWCPQWICNTQKQLRYDIYFCGWAGNQNEWKKCESIVEGQTCQEWVMNNPSYFKEAYWLVNYMDVYQ
eukprot:87072_1